MSALQASRIKSSSQLPSSHVGCLGPFVAPHFSDGKNSLLPSVSVCFCKLDNLCYTHCFTTADPAGKCYAYCEPLLQERLRFYSVLCIVLDWLPSVEDFRLDSTLGRRNRSQLC